MLYLHYREHEEKKGVGVIPFGMDFMICLFSKDFQEVRVK